MFAKIITQLTVWALRCKRLSGEQKAIVTSALLCNLNAFPIADIITTGENGSLQIKGRTLDTEQKISLRESANGLKNSFARRLIHEQMTFKAINLGIHQGPNLDAIVFSKAALWIIQEENALIKQFTGTEIDDE